MNNDPLVSIIIPTLNSSYHIETLLKSVRKQKFNAVEVILADNGSKDSTLTIGNKYKAKIINVPGNPPQVSRQRNMGAEVAKGKYVYFMDHDMELSDNFLKHFSNKTKIKQFAEIDAWYVRERIISKSKTLSVARNFEAGFLDNTVISAARLIKRDSYLKTGGSDERMSAGPADWDLEIELKLKGLKFAIFDKIVYHHEENLSLWKYIFKKTTYIKGEEAYKRKWSKNKQVYQDIVTKQYKLRYRVLGIFVENGKWKKLSRKIWQYLIFLFVKLSLAIVYVNWRNKYFREHKKI